MNATIVRSQSRIAKWGWGTLIVLSALLALNGAGWFFAGPSAMQANFAEDIGMTADEFMETYPSAAAGIAANARQVAIWYLAFGLLALVVTLEGFRHGSRWAWNATWILLAALIAVGVIELPGFGIVLLILAAITLVSQLLARTGMASQISDSA